MGKKENVVIANMKEIYEELGGLEKTGIDFEGFQKMAQELSEKFPDYVQLPADGDEIVMKFTDDPKGRGGIHIERS